MQNLNFLLHHSNLNLTYISESKSCPCSVPPGLLPPFLQDEPNLVNKGFCWLGCQGKVFIPPRCCRMSLLSPPFPAVQREEGLWYSRSTSYHDLITWPEHKGRSVSSEMSPLFLDLAQELTHQNCLRKKQHNFFFPSKIYFFSTGLSTTFVHTSVRSFIHPPENPIVFQTQLMIFRSGLIEPFMADVLNTSHD